MHRFIIFSVLLLVCFIQPLIKLFHFAYNSSLFSYILLVPFISAFLVWLKIAELKSEMHITRWPAVIPAASGICLFVLMRQIPVEYSLTLQILFFCCFFWCGCIYTIGIQRIRIVWFPVLFLIFITPIPPSIVGTIEILLQQASAELSYFLIDLSGIPIYREGYNFYLPQISLSVAQQCSGIRSTLILFLISLISGHLFLRRPWIKFLLILCVIPLGIIRNAFRILTLAVLCVRIDTSYINSPLHHQGGAIFFLLALIPFSAFLLYLRRIEKHTILINENLD